ncbi:LuxR family transcriptional regulator [Streptomyces hygroscopicus subsp. hygroscopicus]|uniref:helix-turn-helix transcriptional regulator n=1 Tax=Streptomyces hygroscopicus TaxID=1912 RepID=UPI0007DB3DB8|nr:MULTISPECIES: response regulator transcription factor [Streptomyces]MBW8087280.1 LuxR family transcriptional regulator [Streptomyces hygroscopicus subsp. hygroscopicus]
MSPFPSERSTGSRAPVAAASVLERAEQLLQLLRGLVRCDAVALTASNPFARSPQHEVLAADGYSDAALGRFLDEFVPDTENPGFRVVRNRSRAALRWSDLARDWDVRFAATSLAEQYLLPAGFHEGVTACLWLPDGSHVGAIHMNWEAAGAATDDRRRMVEQFRPLLAGASNLLQPHRVLADELHGDAHVALLGGGAEQGIPGRDAGPVLRSDGRLWPLLLTSVPHRDGSYLWIDGAGTFHRIDLTRCVDATVLVAEREIPAPYQLTARELQVVTLLAAGASNPEIADVLVVSRRTVSTHVEHILAKLGVASRAQVAALATREGLRLLQPELVRRSDPPASRLGRPR